jgi:hypothetical protein
MEVVVALDLDIRAFEDNGVRNDHSVTRQSRLFGKIKCVGDLHPVQYSRGRRGRLKFGQLSQFFDHLWPFSGIQKVIRFERDASIDQQQPSFSKGLLAFCPNS